MKDEKVIRDSQDSADGLFQDDVRNLSDDELDEIAGGGLEELEVLDVKLDGIKFKPIFM